MNHLNVVLSGPIAAGKSTLCDDLIGQFGFSVFKTRELIQELLKNVPSERAALQKAGETLDRKTNGDWVASSLARKIQEKGSKCHVIVDSVRIKKQIDGLRRAFGSRVVHIKQTADPAILRKRVNLPS